MSERLTFWWLVGLGMQIDGPPQEFGIRAVMWMLGSLIALVCFSLAAYRMWSKP